jgi:hypothetical protein
VVKTTYEVIEFNGGDTMVHARDDLLGNGNSIDVLGIETIT